MVRWDSALRLMALVLLFMTHACSSQGSAPDLATSEQRPLQQRSQKEPPVSPARELPAFQMQELPGLPTHGSGKPHMALELTSVELKGSHFSKASSTTLVNPFLGSSILSSTTGRPGWVMYEFDGLSPNDGLLNIRLDLAQPLPQQCWIALSDYASQSWHWQKISLPLPENTLSVPSEVQPCSPDGSLFCIVLIDATQRSEILSLTLDLDASLPVPQGLTASYGKFAGRVELEWEDPAVSYPGLHFESIVLERSFSQQSPFVFEPLATLSSGTTSYSDVHSSSGPGANPIPYGLNVFYRLRLQRLDLLGPAGLGVSGLRTIGKVGQLDASYDDLDVSSPTFNPAVKGDHVQLDWSAVPEADSYLIEYRNLDNSDPFEWATLASVPGSQTSFSHTHNLESARECRHMTRYEYRVKAGYEGELGLNWSSADIGRRQMAAPAEVGATRGQADTVLLEWTPAPGADGYSVYRDGTAQENKLGWQSGSSFTAEEPGHAPHVYYVQSTLGGDTSSFSDAVLGFSSGWRSYPRPEMNYPNSLGVVGGRPIAAWSSSNSHLICCLAEEASPDGLSDWSQHEVYETDGKHIFTQKVFEYQGKPAIAFASADELWLARALVTSPTSAADWQIQLVADQLPPSAWEKQLAFGLVGGRLVCLYSHGPLGGSGISYLAALNADPQDMSDWTQSSFATVAGWQADCSAPKEVGGLPALAYLDFDGIHYAYADSLSPADADWHTHLVQIGDQFEESSLQVINGKPALFYSRAIPAEMQEGELWQATALQEQPAAAADWQSYKINTPGVINPQLIGLTTTPDSMLLIYTAQKAGEYLICSAESQDLAPSQDNNWAHEAVTEESLEQPLFCGGFAQALSTMPNGEALPLPVMLRRE